MTKTVTLRRATLTAKVRYDIEEDYDYAFLEASTDGGPPGPRSRRTCRPDTDDQSGFNASGTGITGATAGDWVDLTATLPAGTNALRFRYQTDGGFGRARASRSTTSPSAAPSSAPPRPTRAGPSTASAPRPAPRRSRSSTPTSPRTASTTATTRRSRPPTTSGSPTRKPDWVEIYPYQDGMLINYWDTSYADNNVGDHPGGGLILPVDAHPTFVHCLRRPADASADPGLRLDLRARADRRDHDPQGQPDDASRRSRPCRRSTTPRPGGSTGTRTPHRQPRRPLPARLVGVDVPKTGTTITVNGATTAGHLNVTVAPK